MRNILFLNALKISILAIILTGCGKFDFQRHNEPIWQVSISASQLGMNQTLEFSLPDHMIKEIPIISTQANQFYTSELYKNQLLGQWIYRYTPKVGFIGSDQVIIDSEDEAAEQLDRKKRSSSHHSCDEKGEISHFRLILNINISDSIIAK